MPKVDRIYLDGGSWVWVPGDGAATIRADQIFATSLRLIHRRAGEVLADLDLGDGVVTTAGVNLLAADYLSATATLKLANWHDFGTGATAAAIGDTALGAVSIYRAARSAGSQSNPSAGVYRTIGSMVFTGSTTIREWGLFTALTSGTMWDRRVWAGTAVIDQDSIEARYSLTPAAGG